jgi:hypothetical protein
MTFRALLRPLMCLVIIGAYTHCVMAHGSQLLQRAHQVAAEQSPGPEGPSCEDESGCICRGATLVANVQPVPVDNASCLMAIEASLLPMSCDELQVPRVRYSHIPPLPSISASDARAVLQIYLL